ncbi:DUF3553 domain-containing protein [Alicyclobacillus macrosporangiidus]|uniref:Uncharacterized protein n=1 Tax=Alicyclobacillus macrosporangiidus TaxID=392015 RepID=A0A1I7KCD9_9BACL|nr:DUF3553 domain-containing protein [Alicyclobacillus macrosporangiidus]SFU95077.1 Protein of unknown function [Alicyclobacillus macrosporangiidus]
MTEAEKLLRRVHEEGLTEELRARIAAYFETPPFKEGDRVVHRLHPEWGRGTIDGLSLTGKSAYINWDQGGWHGTVLLKYLRKVEAERLR